METQLKDWRISLAEKLMNIYIDGQTYNFTARYIIERLSVRDDKSAMNEFHIDGDKIPQYSEWGREFIDVLYSELGCRLHQVKNCDKPFCKREK